jgi:hypothetical protein
LHPFALAREETGRQMPRLIRGAVLSNYVEVARAAGL